MKTKKSPKADLEGNRSIFFSVGLILSLGIVLAAFSYKTEVRAVVIPASASWNAPEDFVIPVTKPEESKPAPPPVSINEIVVDLFEGQEEANFDDFTDEISQGQAINIDPVLFSHSPETDEVPLVGFAEQMPEFPGGMPALISFLAKNIKYPALAQEIGAQGKVFVRFIVNIDGTIADAVVVRSADQALDQEALRVVRSMPKWRPGLQNGKPVRVIYTVPISFVL